MASATHDLIVIGGGPAGYVGAIRAAQLGLNVACIEVEDALGGTCLRVGCIPSKAMLESSERFWAAKHEAATHGVKLGSIELDLPTMLARKDKVVKINTLGINSLFKKNKVTRYLGHGKILAPGKVQVTAADGTTTDLEAKHILIATGSKVANLRGITMDGDRIGSSTEALSYHQVPQHLIVIGAGVIGLELGSVWARLGAKVTVLEYLDRIMPGMDTEIASQAKKIFEKQGLEFRLGCKVTGATVNGDQVTVSIEGSEPVVGDRVLVAVGRTPNTDNLGLENVGITLDNRGRIPTTPHFATTMPGIYAVGDVIAGPMLAHKAEEEAIACVEHIVTGYGHVNYDAIPAIVYTEPEIASVGKTEDELKQAGVAYRKGTFPYMANGRARALGHTEGMAKILADATTDRILGAHILGARAGDLIAELAVAVEFGASAEDIARSSHAHPTLAEVIKEAALAVDGRAIHM
jgi:dihydrolipoamide dehydrogenase